MVDLACLNAFFETTWPAFIAHEGRKIQIQNDLKGTFLYNRNAYLEVIKCNSPANFQDGDRFELRPYGFLAANGCPSDRHTRIGKRQGPNFSEIDDIVFAQDDFPIADEQAIIDHRETGYYLRPIKSPGNVQLMVKQNEEVELTPGLVLSFGHGNIMSVVRTY